MYCNQSNLGWRVFVNHCILFLCFRLCSYIFGIRLFFKKKFVCLFFISFIIDKIRWDKTLFKTLFTLREIAGSKDFNKFLDTITKLCHGQIINIFTRTKIRKAVTFLPSVPAAEYSKKGTQLHKKLDIWSPSIWATYYNKNTIACTQTPIILCSHIQWHTDTIGPDLLI